MTILKFGMFKDKEVSEMISTNPRYALWLIKQNYIKSDLKDEVITKLDDGILDFGYHKGKRIGTLKDDFPKYYNWLMEKAFITEDSTS